MNNAFHKKLPYYWHIHISIPIFSFKTITIQRNLEESEMLPHIPKWLLRSFSILNVGYPYENSSKTIDLLNGLNNISSSNCIFDSTLRKLEILSSLILCCEWRIYFIYLFISRSWNDKLSSEAYSRKIYTFLRGMLQVVERSATYKEKKHERLSTNFGGS